MNKYCFSEESKQVNEVDDNFVKQLKKSLKGNSNKLSYENYIEIDRDKNYNIKLDNNRIDFVKIKSNSQPSSNTLDSKKSSNLHTSRQKNINLDEMFTRKKEPSISKHSPITIKLQQLKNQFLINDRIKETRELNLNSRVGSSNFQFININSVLSKENILNRKTDPKNNLSSRIKSDNIRKKINEIYLNRTPSTKVNENLRIIENIKENRLKSSDSAIGFNCIYLDPHKQKIEDKKLYLLKMLAV